MSGRVEAGGKKNEALPFVMKMKRPHMSRLELTFQDQTAVQVFDGEQGWKVRPFLGRNDVEPYTAAEEKAAAGWQELDGPLVDYAKKGTKVKLQGMQAVEGHKAYKLQLTLKNGEERHVWIDAKSFLERKIDGDPRKMDGRLHDVAIYYRDYKTEKGLTMPHVFETVVEGAQQSSHKMYIEHVAVNQPMENALFAKPGQALAKVSGQPSQPASGASMRWLAMWMLSACISSLAVAAAEQGLTASQIVEKNVAARGGLDAWRKIQTMVWVGHIESAHAPVPEPAVCPRCSNAPTRRASRSRRKTRFQCACMTASMAGSCGRRAAAGPSCSHTPARS